ncbi:MAG TPA: hypothetical protein VE078_11100, partial [Thermoanaerobaculia bacterium]|nr:hypothetical protein [Thermoanaerobaculia bacterium]
MRTTTLILSAVLLVLATGCQKPAEEETPAAAESPAASEPASSTAPAESPAAAAAPAAPAAETVLASQETNWTGVVAEVTEFRRKGNTLTAKVRLRNQAGADVQTEIIYKEVYLMDLAAGKKYQVLQDEAGAYIAALKSGWTERWYGQLAPGQSQLLWI